MLVALGALIVGALGFVIALGIEAYTRNKEKDVKSS